MKDRDDALRETNDFPAVVKHGRIYWSAGIIALLAGGMASFLITRAQVEAQGERIGRVESALTDVATKKDVEKLGDRMDALYQLLIDRQDARPARRDVP